MSICNIKSVGLELTISKLDVKFESISIKSLCSTDGNEHSLVQLMEETSPLESMLDDYICLAQTHVSTIFDYVWNDKIKDISVESTLAVADIQTKLWEPVISICAELLMTLQQCTITLLVVDKYFSQYKRNKESLLKNLTNLFYGLSMCKYHTGFEGEEGVQQIKKGVDLMQQYWSLYSYADAAQICLKLKEELQLEGDFQIVELLAKQVNIFTSIDLKHNSVIQCSSCFRLVRPLCLREKYKYIRMYV